jgi:hypothetical protein
MLPWAWLKDGLDHLHAFKAFPNLAYLLFVGIFIGGLIPILYHHLKTGDRLADAFNVFVLCVSVPVVMIVERGNSMYFSFFLLYFFLAWYRTHPRLASLCLGAAVAARLYPAIFFVLLFRERRYREVAQAFAVAAVLSAFPMLLFRHGPLYNVREFVDNLFRFQNGAFATGAMRSDIFTMHFSTSFKALFKLPVMLTHLGKVPPSVPIDTIYLVFALLLLAVTLYFVWTEPKFWKQVFLLTALVIMLPPMTYEHNLIYLFLPLLMFVNEPNPEPSDKWFVVLFGLLLAPKGYSVLFFDPPYYAVSLQSIINPALMLGVLFTYFWTRRFGMHWEKPVLRTGGVLLACGIVLCYCQGKRVTRHLAHQAAAEAEANAAFPWSPGKLLQFQVLGVCEVLSDTCDYLLHKEKHFSSQPPSQDENSDPSLSKPELWKRILGHPALEPFAHPRGNANPATAVPPPAGTSGARSTF